MELKQKLNSLKEEINITLQSFSEITEADKKPLLQAIKASDNLWDYPGYVAPPELEEAYDNINAAFEDLCLKYKVSQELIDSLLQRPQMISLSTSLILQNAAKAKLELVRGDLSSHVGAAYEAYCTKWEGKMTDQEMEGIRRQLHGLGFFW